jgi:quercetin dioxygenase-like cupin family protein
VTRRNLSSSTPEDAIEEPVTGQRIVFRRRTSEHVAGDLFVRPGGYVPVHVHALQVERFEGVSGTLRFRLGRKRVTLGPGDTLVVPAGTPHGFRNASREPASFLIELTPPLRGEEGLRTLFGLQRDARLRLTRLRLPRPVLQVAVLFNTSTRSSFPSCRSRYSESCSEHSLDSARGAATGRRFRSTR